MLGAILYNVTYIKFNLGQAIGRYEDVTGLSIISLSDANLLDHRTRYRGLHV